MRWEEFDRDSVDFVVFGDQWYGMAWDPEDGLRRWEISH
jgi:hypothetical protein